MKQIKHTPGPWNVNPTNDFGGVQVVTTAGFARDERLIADLKYSEHTAANAALIAMSPKMLELLEDILENMSGGIINPSHYRPKIRDLIGKARGE